MFSKESGKGVCGKSQWTAARETAKKSGSKVDEEGVEVAVCRHGILFKALNMFRGEIFAYPLFLQKELAMAYKIQFICTDIMCKYYPYLQKVCKSFPELLPLLQNRPFLSVMHAKGHSGKCEVNISILDYLLHCILLVLWMLLGLALLSATPSLLPVCLSL